MDRKTLLMRARLAEKLREEGFQITAGTLATKAARGEGPEYSIFGNRALYEWGNSLDWAKAQVRRPGRLNQEAA